MRDVGLFIREVELVRDIELDMKELELTEGVQTC